MFDYHCDRCGYEFFMEEAYDSELDAIVCPYCGANVDSQITRETKE